MHSISSSKKHLEMIYNMKNKIVIRESSKNDQQIIEHQSHKNS